MRSLLKPKVVYLVLASMLQLSLKLYTHTHTHTYDIGMFFPMACWYLDGHSDDYL
jgi:hypothetical protein